MNSAKIYHSKFGTLETIKSRHILFPRSSHPEPVTLNWVSVTSHPEPVTLNSAPVI